MMYLEQRLDELEQRIARTETTKVLERTSVVEQRMADLAKRNEVLHDLLRQMESRLSGMDLQVVGGRIDRLENSFSQLARESVDERSRWDSLAERMEKFAEQDEANATAVRRLGKSVDGLEEHVLRLEEDRGPQHAAVPEFGAKLSELREEIDGKRQTLRELAAASARRDERLNQFRADLNGVLERVASLGDQPRTAAHAPETGGQVAELSRRLQQLHGVADEKHSQLDNLDEQVQRIAGGLETLYNRFNERQADEPAHESASAAAAGGVAEETVHHLSQRIEENARRSGQVEHQVEQQGQRLDRVTGHMQQLSQRDEELQSQIRQLGNGNGNGNGGQSNGGPSGASHGEYQHLSQELQTLRGKADQQYRLLEKRLTDLRLEGDDEEAGWRKSPWSLVALLALAALGLAALGLYYPSPANAALPDTIVASRFVLRDEAGKDRGEWATDGKSSQLALIDGGDRVRALIATDDQASVVRLTDRSGRDRVTLAEQPGDPSLILADESGTIRTVLGAGRQPGLAIYDAAEQPRLLVVDDAVDGPLMDLLDDRGNRRIRLGTGAVGQGLNLYDGDQKLRAGFGRTDTDGFAMNFFDAAGQRSVVLGSGRQTPALSMLGPLGQQRATLGVSGTGKSVLTLSDEQGEPRVVVSGTRQRPTLQLLDPDQPQFIPAAN